MKEPQKGVVFKSLTRILRLLPGKYKLSAYISFFSLFVNSALDLAGLGAVIPLLIILLDDQAFEKHQFLNELYEFGGFDSQNAFVVFACGVILFIILFKNLLSLGIHYFQARFSYQLQRYFSARLFRAYYAKGFLYFKSLNSANIIRNIQAVPTAFASNVLLPLMNTLNEIVIILFILVGLLFYDAQILLILALVVGPAFIVFFYSTKQLTRRIAEKQHEIAPFLTKNIVESVYGYLDVKVTLTEQQFFNRHERLQEELQGLQTKTQVLKLAPNKILEVALFLGVITMIIYGVYRFDERADLVTMLGVFALSAYRVLPSVNRILVGIISLNGYRYTLDLIEKELSGEVDEEEEFGLEALGFESSISCKELSFSYNDGKPVLNDIDLTLEKGQVVGFVGKSGSGKSTLINLLLGFVEPSNGEIRIDGTLLTRDNIGSWRKKVGYVQQDVYLVDGSIRENVAFGADEEEIDDDRVKRALEMASMGEFVEGLEQGILTEVGERGGKLSGGQRQRVGIARALYFGAEVLFFDEATSALDNETEREVTEAIHRLQKEDLTMFIIAHRVTTLKFCDRIFELENGQFKGELTYNELIDKTVGFD